MSEVKDLIKEIKRIKSGRTVWSSKTIKVDERVQQFIRDKKVKK